MSTQHLDLIIRPLGGDVLSLSFETDRFRPAKGQVAFARVADGYTVGSMRIFGSNLIGIAVLNDAQVTNDIAELARACGHLEEFVSGSLNHDGGTILLRADVAEREAFRLANLLYEAYGNMLHLNVWSS